jgi:tRNA modification GTPase
MTIDTIVAQATPAGYAGVGIIRISGPLVPEITVKLLGSLPSARLATYHTFRATNQDIIDQGIALYFPQPHSFTGEDILELHTHGSPIVIDLMQQHIITLGARYARPGEFSERAFLNNKIDLAQAEAIADLIHASSSQAARAAMRSLQGEFSRQIKQLVTAIIELRMYVEAAIDFVEEEIDFLATPQLQEQLNSCQQQLVAIKQQAQQGSLLRDGITTVIAGATNVGKSTLLNYLSGTEAAIVTDIPGTTRDLLHEHINIDGLPIHIIDTAGLRESSDLVEQEGIRRAHTSIQTADLILHVIDASAEPTAIALPEVDIPTIIIRNKIDLVGETASSTIKDKQITVSICAKQQQGLQLLHQAIKHAIGFNVSHTGCFAARQRHLLALDQAAIHLDDAMIQLTITNAAELVAEALRQAQLALATITGEVTTDDLLAKIFATFCIGK